MTYVKGQRVFVPLGDVYAPGDRNIRSSYGIPEFDALSRSMEANGQRRPCQVRIFDPQLDKVQGDGDAPKLIMEDGFTRYAIRKTATWSHDGKGVAADQLLVVIKPSLGEQAEDLLVAWEEENPNASEEDRDAAHSKFVEEVRLETAAEDHEINATRESWKPYDQAKSYLRLLKSIERKDPTLPREEMLALVGKKTGMSVTAVAAGLDLLDPEKTPMDVQEALASQDIGTSAARELARILDKESREKLISVAVEEGLSLNQLRTKITKAVEEAGKEGKKIKHVRKSRKVHETRTKEECVKALEEIAEAKEEIDPDKEPDISAGMSGATATLQWFLTPAATEGLLPQVISQVEEDVEDEVDVDAEVSAEPTDSSGE